VGRADLLRQYSGKIAMVTDTETARRNMVRQQIRCWDVFSPRILEVLENVPREHFVPAQFANLAFADTMLPLDTIAAGDEQKMLKPNLEGRILQELDIRATDKALVIGTGSGYLTACLARLARHVTSVDTFAARIEKVQQRCDDLGITNIDLYVQDVFDQPVTDRFDVIAVAGSLPVYDSGIEAWLNPGGRAFVVVGTAPAMEACLIEKSGTDEISYRSLFETVIPALVNAPLPASIEFTC
jgi:protein-L-isoaspartate(D-aspartate) O-methyltransferase